VDKDRILIDLSESTSSQFGKVEFQDQSPAQRVFSAIWSLESEVNNGGFSQYFQNTSAETAPYVAEALDAIGATETAKICRSAIASAFPKGLPMSPEAISSSADEFPTEIHDALDLLDEAFFKYPNNLTDLLFEYVSKHPEEFGTLPKPDSTQP